MAKHDLTDSRNFVNQFRYSEDNHSGNLLDNRDNDHLNNYFLNNSLLVSESITPGIHKTLVKALDNLKIPHDCVSTYIYSSPEIQASCQTGNDSDCIVRISSGLIEILDEDELEFVIGHELGHFLLKHNLSGLTHDNGLNYEKLILNRSQEVSADRVGLIACQSLDASVRALMKTISGLSSKYLKFNVSAFISQIREASKNTPKDENTTHPSMFIRCRALLWFSMSKMFHNQQSFDKDELIKLDNKIREDLDNFYDSSLRDKIKNIKEDLKLWLSLEQVILDNAFSKEEQEIIKDKFGNDTLNKVKNFFANFDSVKDLKMAIKNNIEESQSKLQSAIPSTFENEIQKINSEITASFN